MHTSGQFSWSLNGGKIALGSIYYDYVNPNWKEITSACIRDARTTKFLYAYALKAPF